MWVVVVGGAIFSAVGDIVSLGCMMFHWMFSQWRLIFYLDRKTKNFSELILVLSQSIRITLSTFQLLRKRFLIVCRWECRSCCVVNGHKWCNRYSYRSLDHKKTNNQHEQQNNHADPTQTEPFPPGKGILCDAGRSKWTRAYHRYSYRCQGLVRRRLTAHAERWSRVVFVAFDTGFLRTTILLLAQQGIHQRCRCHRYAITPSTARLHLYTAPTSAVTDPTRVDVLNDERWWKDRSARSIHMRTMRRCGQTHDDCESQGYQWPLRVQTHAVSVSALSCPEAISLRVSWFGQSQNLDIASLVI